MSKSNSIAAKLVYLRTLNLTYAVAFGVICPIIADFKPKRYFSFIHSCVAYRF